jgi:uncharacterized membrane protein YebE (DUF533 family)
MLDIADAQLELNHVQFLVRALHDLAETDGVHEAERILLRAFYDQCQGDAHALSSFEDLVRSPFDPAGAVEMFRDDAQKAVLLHSCFLLAYADGSCSAGERAKIQAFGTALGVSGQDMASLEDAVRDWLMQEIAQIENVDALTEVARELGG